MKNERIPAEAFMSLVDAYLESGLVFSPAKMVDPWDREIGGCKWSCGLKNSSAVTVWWQAMAEGGFVPHGAILLPEWFWHAIVAAIIFDGYQASWVNTAAELPSGLP